PGQMLGRIVAGERQRDLALLARARADERLLKAWNQVAAAELDQLVATFAALELHKTALRRLALITILAAALDERADLVDHDEVALGGSSLSSLQTCQALAHAVDLGVDLLLLGGRLAARHREALVVAQL